MQKKTKLFIIASFTALIFVPVAIKYLNFQAFKYAPEKSVQEQKANQQTKEYQGYDTSDPFITKTTNLEQLLKGPIITDIDEVFGPATAKVTITYFGDYDCKHCLKQLETIKSIVKKEYAKDVKFVWKDFLTSSDKESLSYNLAIANRCAGEQNKFWEFQDQIINIKEVNVFNSIDTASKLNLNIDDFKNCTDNNNAILTIEDNKKEGYALNIPGVPFIYINKQEFMGELTEEELRRVIKLELK
ncbi:DsbA family protein [Patescibacteria group bacterium]|nr:DsbA family protein [Patescibacteria group bacterium]